MSRPGEDLAVSDHYRLLQVRRDASAAVIAAAYRRLMRDAHPDAGGDAEHAKRLNAAYAVLSDPAQRRAYDRTLARETGLALRPLPEDLAFRFGRWLGRQSRRDRGAV